MLAQNAGFGILTRHCSKSSRGLQYHLVAANRSKSQQIAPLILDTRTVDSASRRRRWSKRHRILDSNKLKPTQAQ